jgi:hypothetical protein
MDPTQPARPQRSPWLYILIGCLGLALLMCLGGGAFLAFAAKKVNDVAKGVTDPATREANARQMLGTIPEGYYPHMTLSMFGLMDLAVLADSPLQEDGGTGEISRRFIYFRVMANENSKKAKRYFTQPDVKDSASLRQAGVNVDVREVIKRGTLTVDGRKLLYVAGRGSLDTGSKLERQEGLQASIFFECPGEDLRIGVWMMPDPAPTKPASELDLTGTVADEAEMARFLQPINPCGK